MKPKTWAYGVTTVSERMDNLLPRTLRSLAKAGFNEPRLFIDGTLNTSECACGFDLEVTTRYPVIKTFGNWILALWELYVRDPTAWRYAIFQDDFVTYPNLREYLNRCEWPTEKGYFNLLTFMDNEDLVHEGNNGWVQSHQWGRGAVALVFDRDAVTTLLAQPHLANKPRVAGWRQWRKIDGTILEAFRQAGYEEYVHVPSLVQHTGDVSVIGNQPHPEAKSFQGENFDALRFLP